MDSTNKQLQFKFKNDSLKRAKIKIKPSVIHRYGVFSEQDINKGEIIEECPVALFSEYIEKFHDYVFNWDDKQSAFALGYGSLYNHSKQPNAKYYMDKEHELLVFTAAEKIHKGEEIFVSYGSEWFKNRDLAPRELKELKPSSSQKAIRLLLVAFILLLLLVITAKLNANFNPSILKSPFRFGEVSTTVTHEQNSKHSETPSTVPRK